MSQWKKKKVVLNDSWKEIEKIEHFFHSCIFNMSSGVNAGTLKRVEKSLRPGAYAVVFSSQKSYAEDTFMMEDAGFEIRDMLVYCFQTASGLAKIEPIVIVRKRMEGTLIDNMNAWNCGALNINACRINLAESSNNDDVVENDYLLGRFPAGVLLENSKAVQDLFPQTKKSKSGLNVYNANYPDSKTGPSCHDSKGTVRSVYGFGDEGTAARYFSQFKKENSRFEIIKWLCKLITYSDGIIINPFMIIPTLSAKRF